MEGAAAQTPTTTPVKLTCEECTRLFPEVRTKEQGGIEFELYIQKIVRAIDAVQVYIISRFFRKRTIRIFPIALPSKKGNVERVVTIITSTI